MLFGITIFLSAFLLFQVQFIIGKQLLPWFGGAPAVWSACQVFFQSALLAGYAYAHAVTRASRPRRQAIIHVSLLALACAWLAVTAVTNGVPLLPGPHFKPDPAADPVQQLLGALLASVGLPFVVLAANAPLVQSWHARAGRPLDQTYRLYALSNAGSLLGLLTYPFGFERVFTLSAQAWVWSGLFVAFGIACALVARRTMRAASVAPVPSPGAAIPQPEDEPETWRRAPSWPTLLLWGLLPCAASLMLVATTNQLCQDVAVVPFLWMLPLALYLATFMISFDRPRWYSRGIIAPAALVSGAAIYVARHTATTPVAMQMVVFGLFIFLFCLIAHGELARLRPKRAHLTLYYLVIATGGALGAAAVSLIAPAVFSDFWEFHGGIAAGWLIFAMAWWRDRTSPFFRGAPAQYAVFVAIVAYALLAAGLAQIPSARVSVEHDVVPWFAGILAINLTIIVALLTWYRPVAAWAGWPRLFAALTCAAFATSVYGTWRDRSASHLVVGRNFYGVVRLRLYINDSNQLVLQLKNGNINHGAQLRDATLRRTPTTYYAPHSGVGLAIEALRERRATRPLHVGVLGLGTGTLAAYAQSGDSFRFYEINPLVIRLSKGDPPIFTFVSDSRAEVTVAPGDARLSLEQELRTEAVPPFDLLALDVFSSDAIPVHLMTLEAFEIYRARLRDPDGILAVHTSNRFLDLEPVVAALARRLGLHATMVEDIGGDPGATPSSWILVTRDASVLAPILGASTRPLRADEVLFTDQYSNLFSILNR